MNLLKYSRPAEDWNHALPLGNGFTGIMAYGDIKNETLCFNDCTLWSGYPRCDDQENIYEDFEAVRKLIFNGENLKADRLADEALFGGWSATYLPLGDISMEFSGLCEKNYKRTLDLEHAIHTVTADGVKCEMFASYPDRVCVMRIKAQNKFNVKIGASSRLRHSVSTDNGLNLFGNAPDRIIPRGHGEDEPVRFNEKKSMGFALRLQVTADGIITYGTDNVLVSEASDVTVYFVTATGYKGFDKLPEHDSLTVLKKCIRQLDNLKKDYDAIKARHTEDFSNLYNRQKLCLGTESDLDTDETVKLAADGGRLDVLSQLMYNMGKYLMISGSRKGTQPLNLQGIWNSLIRPPWSCNYTTNINTQMNYWASSACGLSACIEPLIRMMKEISVTGHHTASAMLGAEGFCCNHNTDIWRKTSPSMGSIKWFFSPLCGAWLVNELYKHYLNGELSDYRDDIFYLVKKNAEFLMTYLVSHNGQYVICPSVSPENAFILNSDTVSLDYATAYDMAITRESLGFASECSDSPEEKSRIDNYLEHLYPLQKGSHGICEYHKDYTEFEPGHRHFSPLYAFYPSDEIGYNSDPERSSWIRQLFLHRLDNSHQHIGWSAVWAMCIAARLRDAVTEEKVIRHFITHAIFDNLFCFHEPSFFQIDGNFGFIAGMNELLITEEKGKIELLPAILPEYKNGQMENIIIKGAKISFKWTQGLVTEIISDKPVTVYKRHLSPDISFNENILFCD